MHGKMIDARRLQKKWRFVSFGSATSWTSEVRTLRMSGVNAIAALTVVEIRPEASRRCCEWACLRAPITTSWLRISQKEALFSACIERGSHHLEPELKLGHVKTQTHVAKQRNIGCGPYFALWGSYLSSRTCHDETLCQKTSLLRLARLPATNNDCKAAFYHWQTSLPSTSVALSLVAMADNFDLWS